MYRHMQQGARLAADIQLVAVWRVVVMEYMED